MTEQCSDGWCQERETETRAARSVGCLVRGWRGGEGVEVNRVCKG